jgi:hypothetical protein
VESLTALAEDFDGKLHLIHWRGRLTEPMNLGRIVDEVSAGNSVPA